MSSALTRRPGHSLIGRNELGSITVNPNVVSKVAARASIEIPEVGAAQTRMLGLSVPGASLVGGRDTDLSALPKASAEVHGSSARLDLEVAVLWPHSVKNVTERLRAGVIEDVHRICGVTVSDVRITVAEFSTTAARHQSRVK